MRPRNNGDILLSLHGSDRLGIEVKRMAQDRNRSEEWALLMDEWHPAWDLFTKLSNEVATHFAQFKNPPEDLLLRLDEASRTVEALKQRRDALIEEWRRGN